MLSDSQVFFGVLYFDHVPTQGRHAMELGAAPGQEKVMRIKGLECLVSILKCMVEWSRELFVNPASQSNLTEENDSQDLRSNTSSGGSQVNLASSTIPSSGSAYQFEEIKQQKEILEQGIELYVEFFVPKIELLRVGSIFSASTENRNKD